MAHVLSLLLYIYTTLAYILHCNYHVITRSNGITPYLIVTRIVAFFKDFWFDFIFLEFPQSIDRKRKKLTTSALSEIIFPFFSFYDNSGYIQLLGMNTKVIMCLHTLYFLLRQLRYFWIGLWHQLRIVSPESWFGWITY